MSTAPTPERIAHFAYLWRLKTAQCRIEATKDRPCVVLLVDTETVLGREIVSVLPITHSPPENPGDALELPPPTKRRLGLDEARSWIVVTESNDFTFARLRAVLAPTSPLSTITCSHFPRIVIVTQKMP